MENKIVRVVKIENKTEKPKRWFDKYNLSKIKW